MHYSDWEQRLMDQKSGEELDRAAARHLTPQNCPHCEYDSPLPAHGWRWLGLPRQQRALRAVPDVQPRWRTSAQLRH